MLTNEERALMAMAYKQGLEDCWKIIRRGDREHPEWEIPFEVWRAYAEIRGRYEDRIVEIIEDDGVSIDKVIESDELNMTMEQMEAEIKFMRAWDKFLEKTLGDTYRELSYDYARAKMSRALKSVEASEEEIKEIVEKTDQSFGITKDDKRS